MDRVSGTFEPPDLTRPLAGRQREQRELASLLDRALRGYGSVILMSGEAGIGKTTLSDWLATCAREQRATTLTGHCYNLTAGQPYTPWIEIRRTLDLHHPEIIVPAFVLSSDQVSGPGSQIELFEQVTAALHAMAAHTALVLTLEDIHWADSASLELLRHIARQAANLPMLLIATYREDETEPGHALPDVLPDIIRESRAQRFELHRFSLQDVQALVDHTCGPGSQGNAELAAYLHQRADGNPFFMTELLRDLDRDGLPVSGSSESGTRDLQSLPVPSLVRQVIGNRVQRLTDETRKMLYLAAVFGQEIPVALWQQVASASDQQLLRTIDEAISCHLLSESQDGASLRFVHGLIQETLYQGQLALRRRELHRKIAELLLNHPDPGPGAIAHHFDQAGDQRAISWLVKAAGRAQATYAAQDAVRYVNRAARLAQEYAQSLPPEAIRIRARAREMRGEIDAAREDYEALLLAAQDDGDRVAECQTLIDLGLHWAGHDYQQCGEYLQKALTLAQTIGDDPVHAQCLNRVANWQANTGQFAYAIALHQAALQMFELIGDADGIADTLDLLGSTHYLTGNYVDSARYFDRAILQSRRSNDRIRLTSSLANLSLIGGDFDISFDAGLSASRSPETWIGYGEEAVEVAREIGWKSGESFALAMLGACVAVRGDVGRGLHLLEQAQDIAHRLGHQQWLTGSSLILGSLWYELLDPSRAALHFQRCRTLAQGVGSHMWSILVDSAQGVLQAENEDVASGLALIEPWTKSEPSSRSHAWRALQFAAGRARLAAGEPERALHIAEQLLSLAETPPDVIGVPQILRLKALALAMLDRIDEADRTFQDASRSAETLDYLLVQWRILADWSRVADRRGQARQAIELRDSAGSIVHTIAASISDPEVREHFRSRAHKLIRGNGEPRSKAGNPAGLSQREFEVLALVARGLTDAQVGEKLFISPRTVARHLQSIYSKLGVNSRTGATAFAYQHNLIP